VHAFWCRAPSTGNFGDALGPWIIERLTGRAPRFAAPDAPVDKLLCAGSIIEYARERCTVWGSGILSRDDRIDPRADLRAVRGPLTRSRALECGADCPAVYGDPALLLPPIYQPAPAVRSGIGIVPHWSERHRLEGRIPVTRELRLIDVRAPVTHVIDAIASCEAIIASSLHGVIVAHAYGVPALHVAFGPLPNGDGSKFTDYLLSVEQEPRPPLVLDPHHLELDRVSARFTPPHMALDLEPLWRAFPLWNA